MLVFVREGANKNTEASDGPTNKVKIVSVSSPKSRKCHFEVNS